VSSKIFINSLELSSDYCYLLASVHIVEYLDKKAKKAYVNKDILISLQDLRSPIENQNPGFAVRNQGMQSQKSKKKKQQDLFKLKLPNRPANPSKDDNEEEEIHREALDVVQNISL